MMLSSLRNRALPQAKTMMASATRIGREPTRANHAFTFEILLNRLFWRAASLREFELVTAALLSAVQRRKAARTIAA